jgi:hypothetical protein
MVATEESTQEERQAVVENIIEPNSSGLNSNDTSINFADFANFSENFPLT